MKSILLKNSLSILAIALICFGCNSSNIKDSSMKEDSSKITWSNGETSKAPLVIKDSVVINESGDTVTINGIKWTNGETSTARLVVKDSASIK